MENASRAGDKVALGVIIRRYSELYLRSQWFMVDHARKGPFDTVLATLRRIYRAAEARSVTRLENQLQEAGGNPALVEVSRIVDVSGLNRDMQLFLDPRLEDTARAGFRMGLFRVGITGLDFTSGRPATRAALEATLNQAQGSNPTLSARVAAKLQAAISGGATRDDLIPIVRKVFAETRRGRARTIAQTSITPAFEIGQQAAFVDAGIETVRWLSQRDGAVRATHIQAEADNEDIPLGAGFEVGSSVLEYPGDPAGPAGEVINCRCTILPVIK